jgi:hypothetical protein
MAANAKLRCVKLSVFMLRSIVPLQCLLSTFLGRLSFIPSGCGAETTTAYGQCLLICSESRNLEPMLLQSFHIFFWHGIVPAIYIAV